MSVVTRLRKTYTYLRWKLKAPRYLGKFVRERLSRNAPTANAPAAPAGYNELLAVLRASGYGALRDTAFKLPEVDLAQFAGKARHVPLYNALPQHWQTIKPLVCEVLKDPQVADTLVQYFDGQPWLWNIGLNYSEASDGIQESQLWHFDYGDVKQLHAMLYFSDVDDDCGPFTFFPSELSDRVTRSRLEIERFTDDDLRTKFEISVAQSVRLTGARRDFFFVDPGRAMHQGARCVKPRLVLFLTFTSPTPMSLGGSHTLRAAQRRDLYRDYLAAAGPAPTFREEFFL